MTRRLLQSVEALGLLAYGMSGIDLEDNAPTIITGGNGSGKSTLLRLVYAASSTDMQTLATAPLRRFSLTFSHTYPFILERQTGSRWELTWGQHRWKFALDPVVLSLPDWAQEVLKGNQGDVDDLSSHLPEYVSLNDVGPQEYRKVRDAIEVLRDREHVFQKRQNG